MTASPPTRHRLDRQLPLIIGALCVAVAPHVIRLPLWVDLWCAGLWALAWISARRKSPGPRRKYLLILAVTGFGGGFLTHGGSLNSDACVTLLTVMAGLKPLEVYAYRDKMVSLFLAYFIVITNLFYADTLAMAGYMFLSVWLTTAAVIRIHREGKAGTGSLRLAAVLMGQALPVMLVLFFLFPRLQGSLVGITRQSAGRSGLSDRISPGSLARLNQNQAIAFRVRFDGPAPPPGRQYWRAVVFHIFDGRSWLRGIPRPTLKPPPEGSRAYRYSITMEPHQERWLFALEMPGQRPSGSFFMGDGTLYARYPVTTRQTYTLRSFTDAALSPESPPSAYARQVPGDHNPRAIALARSWRREIADHAGIVNRALRFFSDQGFRYSLTPPTLPGEDPVDRFLFTTREGYCEHFASSFALLMRAAGIPARVVGGYLGGELNPYGAYLIVRQSHAHAWAEVWLAGKGWVRVDPTSVVAPERVSRTVQAQTIDDTLFGLVPLDRLGPLADLARVVQLGWDAVNAYWTFQIIGYTALDQRNLLGHLGLETQSWRVYLYALAVGALLILLLTGLLLFQQWWSGRPLPDAALRHYNRFCRKMARAGIARPPHQGPAAFSRQVGRHHPELAEEVTAITRLYIQIRYAGRRDAAAIRALRHKVGRFHPQRRMA